MKPSSLALVLALAIGPALAQAPEKKVLRVAFNTPESTFDPVKISDLYSRTVTPHIFEALYQYDHLARPARIKPLTADGMPEVSADYRTWTFRVRPGIYFQDDPAFKGVRRELTAKDYVYSILRTADPANRSELWTWIASYKMLGLAEKRQKHLDDKTPFDYDTEPEGLRTLDRYTLRVKLQDPNPRLVSMMAGSDLLGAVAREVVEFYGDKIGEHPVGTGPFRLKSWRRSSQIVLERNPGYRERYFDAEPAPDDAEGQAILAKLKGKRIPIVDEVVVSVIEEQQPQWLAFLRGEIDALASKYNPVPPSFVPQAMPNGRIAPNLAKRGVQGRQALNPDLGLLYFNMEDPVVGGYTPEKVALRRAIGLGMDIEREIRIVRRGQAVPAQSNLVPHTTGYRADFKSEAGDYDPARARGLLDLYGYVDKDGDGWRDLPDGRPLVLVRATQPEQVSRQFDELFRKNMQALGLRVRFETAKWPENLKAARAGKLQMWSLAFSAAGEDGHSALYRLHGPQSGSQNLARFKNAEFDALYDRIGQMPDGPEREALFDQAKRIAIAYAAYKPTVHRISTDVWYPWLTGYRRPLFWNEWWHLVDVDMAMRAEALQ
ncbi:MAG: ABC transporter substrate-binding protein [Rubrivivax sp.]